MKAFKIRRANYEIEVKKLGKLKAVELGEDVAAIFARGLLHYDKEIGKLAVEKQGEGKDAKLVALPWSAESQAAIELRLEALLGVVFEDVEIATTRRVKAEKVDIGAVMAEGMRKSGLSEEAIKAAVEAAGFVYAEPAAPSAAASAEEGVQMA